MTMRIVHDPDTGCLGPPKGRRCPLNIYGMWMGAASIEKGPADPDKPAPSWCPLRAGDVVVTAGKDGG